MKNSNDTTSADVQLRGRIDDFAQFESMHPLFPKVFAFMRRSDLAQLPCGRQEIDGDNCWANVNEVDMQPYTDEARYEVHRKYIDVHVPLTAVETIGVVETPPGEPKEFDDANDFGLFTAKGTPWKVAPGEFAIFFPGEAHAPGLSSDGAKKARKIVIKVRL